jgi:drug/metabolite transporter (DMT)-like permease
MSQASSEKQTELSASARQAITARANRAGILWMSFGMSAFIGNDALIKAVGTRVPAAQMIVVRGVMAIALILLVAWRMGALDRLRDIARGWVVVRAGCEGVGTFLYLAGLFHLPLANVTAINLASPLFIAVLARLIYQEQVSAARWLAIGLGFCGVMMIIQPSGEGFNIYALMSLAATLIFAGRDLMTRKIPPSTPSILITLATASTVWLLAGGVLSWQGWVPMSWHDLGLLAIASVFLSAGYYSVIAAMRQGEMSVVAPFRYVGLLWALLIGFVIWGDIPNALAWAGIALLIGAGLYMLRQQRTKPA